MNAANIRKSGTIRLANIKVTQTPLNWKGAKRGAETLILLATPLMIMGITEGICEQIRMLALFLGTIFAWGMELIIGDMIQNWIQEETKLKEIFQWGDEIRKQSSVKNT